MPTFNNNGEYRPIQFGETAEIPIAGQEQADTEVQGQEQPAVEPVGQPEVQRKDRAKARIKQLASEKNAAKQEAADYKRMYEEALTKMQTDTKVTNASLKTTLEQQYATLLQQYGDAIRAGEADKVVQFQDTMFSIKIQLDKLQTAERSAPAESAQNRVSPPAEQAAPRLPELARMWIDDHPAFKTDEVFHAASITVNNQLLREGYDTETEEFYEALSARLSKRFPEVFGTQEESMVQYKGYNSTDDEPVAKTPTHRQVRTQEQVVSGSARPSANTIRSNKSSNSQVNFEKNDSDLLNAWGLDPVKVAKRIKHNEAHRQTDGYVPIIIPRNQQ